MTARASLILPIGLPGLPRKATALVIVIGLSFRAVMFLPLLLCRVDRRSRLASELLRLRLGCHPGPAHRPPGAVQDGWQPPVQAQPGHGEHSACARHPRDPDQPVRAALPGDGPAHGAPSPASTRSPACTRWALAWPAPSTSRIRRMDGTSPRASSSANGSASVGERPEPFRCGPGTGSVAVPCPSLLISSDTA